MWDRELRRVYAKGIEKGRILERKVWRLKFLVMMLLFVSGWVVGAVVIRWLSG